MIPYCLNRKLDVQDSKYAPRLLLNKIAFLQASPKTQTRVDNLACCNPSGKPGRSIARDQQNEHKVKKVKNLLRGLHSQLTDLSVEKSIVGSNILDLIESHDRQSMLLDEEGGKKSLRYLSEDQIKKIRAEIQKHEPFNTNRETIIDYFDKPRGVFSGLTVAQIERFIVRNKRLFKRNSPHRSNVREKKFEDVLEPGDNGRMDVDTALEEDLNMDSLLTRPGKDNVEMEDVGDCPTLLPDHGCPALPHDYDCLTLLPEHGCGGSREDVGSNKVEDFVDWGGDLPGHDRECDAGDGLRACVGDLVAGGSLEDKGDGGGGGGCAQ